MTTTSISELAPCPFCGGTAVLRQDDDPGFPFYVTFDHADQCVMYAVPTDMYRSFATEAEATSAWNTRPITTDTQSRDGLVERVARECTYHHPVGTRCPICQHWPYAKGGAAEYNEALRAFGKATEALSRSIPTAAPDDAAVECDVATIRAHAARVLERMSQTPHGPKRKLLARQHVELTNQALRAEGWNAAIAALTASIPDAAPEGGARITKPLTWENSNPSANYPEWYAYAIGFKAHIDTSRAACFGKFPLAINGHTVAEKFDTLKAAKAYAQADFEDRVASCLTTTAQREVVQADREAAAALLGGATPDGLLEGKQDSLSLVQTLRDHRLALSHEGGWTHVKHAPPTGGHYAIGGYVDDGILPRRFERAFATCIKTLDGPEWSHCNPDKAFVPISYWFKLPGHPERAALSTPETVSLKGDRV